MRVGIIGAMEEEVSFLRKHMSEVKETEWKIFKFYEGKLFGKEVVVVKTGVGKVFSAMITQHLIDKFNVGSVIFTGVAGALNKNLRIGDIVVGIDSMHYDLDISALGFELGQIPYTNYRFFKAEKKLIDLALNANLDKNKIILGRILTGEKFFTHSDKEEKGYLVEELKGDCIEMEGASVAQVCHINEIPHLIIRTISDEANGNAAEDFTKFKDLIASNSFEILKEILTNM